MTWISNFWNWLTWQDLLLITSISSLFYLLLNPLQDSMKLRLTWLAFGFLLLLKFITDISFYQLLYEGVLHIPFFIFWSSWVISLFHFAVNYEYGKKLLQAKRSLFVFFVLITVFSFTFFIF